MNTKSFDLSKLVSTKQLISRHFVIICLFLSMGFAQLNAQVLKVFSDIQGRRSYEQSITTDSKYTCRVRNVGDANWQNAFVIQTKSLRNPSEFGGTPDNGFFKELENWTHSYIAFESNFSSVVEVEISKVNGVAITKVPTIRPAGEATVTLSGGKAYVRFSKAANVYVDIDGQMEDRYTGAGYTNAGGAPIHAITIFANPIYNAPVATSNYKVLTIQPTGHNGAQTIRTLNDADWDAIVFAPGVHNIGTQYNLKSNKTLYIPGNAIVHGTIHPTVGNTNWKVYGSGAISGEHLTWGATKETKNKVFTNKQGGGITLEGFVVIDPTNHTFNMGNSGTAINVYRNLKILGWRKNGDGFNAFDNSTITDCFLRTQDDCFYLGYNVKIERITTWTDANGAVMYLAKSDANSYFKDIKVIYNRKKWHGWNSGVISMRNTDGDITNVLCQNINVEDPFPTVGLFYGTINLVKEKTHNPYNFSNIVFENITQQATRMDGNKQDLLGSSKNVWRNITFKNCRYKGVCLNSLDDGNWIYNTHVQKSSIVFQCGIPVSSVSISNCPGASMQINQTHTLSATVLPTNATNKSVTWSSSNTAVATVNATTGLVTAKAAGSATITVTTVDGSKTATCNITVAGASSGNGSVVELSQWVSGTTFSLTNGSNRLLTVMIMGEHRTLPVSAIEVKYGTKAMTKVNEQILGTGYRTYAAVFILKESDLSVLPTTNNLFITWDGDNEPNEGFDVYSVLHGNVNQTTPIGAKATNALTGTTISTSALASSAGDMLLMCGATAANADDCTFNNGFIKKFESAKQWGDGVGGSKLSTGASETPSFRQEASGRMVICAMVIKRKSSGSSNAPAIISSNNELNISTPKLKLYPNPATDEVTIDFASVENDSKEVRIYNTTGQLLHSARTIENSMKINVAALNLRGVVTVQVVSGNQVSSHKLVVK